MVIKRSADKKIMLDEEERCLTVTKNDDEKLAQKRQN